MSRAVCSSLDCLVYISGYVNMGNVLYLLNLEFTCNSALCTDTLLVSGINQEQINGAVPLPATEPTDQPTMTIANQ